MADDAVAIVRCGKYGRSSDLSFWEQRFWCAWCQVWAIVEVERVLDVRIDRSAPEPQLSIRPQDRDAIPFQPLRIPVGWLMSYRKGLYEVDPPTEAAAVERLRWLFD